MYAICAYMVTSANRFFRILRGSGVWLHGDTAIAARVAGDEMNESRLAFDIMVFPLPHKLPSLWLCFPFLILYILHCQTQESYAHLATLTFAKGWKLYKYRPKYHLGCHLCQDLPKDGVHGSINPCCPLS